MKKKSNTPRRSSTNSDHGDGELQKLLTTETYRLIKDGQQTIIDKLYTEAVNGDENAFTLLVALSVDLAFKLRTLTEVQFDIARQVARRTPFWPWLISKSPKLFADSTDMTNRLELGRDCEVPISLTRAFKEATIPRKMAVFTIMLLKGLQVLSGAVAEVVQIDSILQELTNVESAEQKACVEILISQKQRSQAAAAKRRTGARSMLGLLNSTLEISKEMSSDFLEQLARKAHALPPLTKRSVKKWTELGEELLLFLTDQHPEKNAILRKVGEYRKDACYRKDVSTRKDFEIRKASAKAKASEESNIRDGILQRIRSAYLAVMGENGLVELSD